MAKTRLEIDGMTCGGCERHVAAAIEAAGGRHPQVDWRQGTATTAGALDEERFRAELAGTQYAVRGIQEIAREGRSEASARDYDLIVLGSGSGAFAGAIRARDLGRSVLL